LGIDREAEGSKGEGSRPTRGDGHPSFLVFPFQTGPFLHFVSHNPFDLHYELWHTIVIMYYFLGKRMKTEVSTVTTKGQLVIPSKLRRKYSIKEGTQVAFLEQENRLVLQPLTPEFIRSLRGSLKGEPSALKALLEDRKRDREL
jgi:AbrB family looped-hinge helix DNA binding protein